MKTLRSEQSQSNFDGQASNRGTKTKTFVINLSKGLNETSPHTPIRRQTYDFPGSKGLVSLDIRRSAETGLALRNKADPADEGEEKLIEKGTEEVCFKSQPCKIVDESAELQASQIKNLSKATIPEEQKTELNSPDQKAERAKWEEAMRKELNNVTESSDSAMSGITHKTNLISPEDEIKTSPNRSETPLVNIEN